MSIEILKVPDNIWNHKYNFNSSIYFEYSGISEFLEYIFKKFNYENLIYDFSCDDSSNYSLLKFYSNNIVTNEPVNSSLENAKSLILQIRCNFSSSSSNMTVYTVPEISDDNDGVSNSSSIVYYVTKDNNNHSISPCYYSGKFNEYNIISGILATPNCISFEFRYCNYEFKNNIYDALKPSTFQLVLSRTKKGNWAVITPFSTPLNVPIYYQKIFDSTNGVTNNGYNTNNNIVCYSLNSNTDEKFNITPGDLGKSYSVFSFEPIPVINDDDYCLGCYFNFHSNIKSPGLIIVDSTKYYYNGWLSIEE